ncbi:LysR family transcriptional regulator [Lactobacillus sp. ESL0785]|uniref:LysR family transcriptional regulator n=1 Tax=Lactobacillus sp. ESL0785 TaxID=2983232 RepID=UPI0023F846F4|nr:LysR family transcriptional regulator [Lactobacillus sp. ESL0785]WEV70478.1 LysR family transcriptional regulator [Lactobacillus sp. ESL0785]
MNFDHLKIFINLAETLNFSKTAASMSVSQPAVSQAIHSLENEIGFTLFQRTKREVKLTVSGHMFYTKVQLAVKILDKAIFESRENYQREKSSLTIGLTGTSFEAHILPKLIRDYCQLNQDIRVYVEYYDHNQLKQNLIQQTCDVIFTTEDDVVDYKEIAYYSLIKGNFSVAVPSNNLLVRNKKIKLDMLNNQRIILFVNSWCPPEQLKLQNLIKTSCPDAECIIVNNFAAIDTMVESGLGIAVIPDFTEYENHEFFKIIPLDYPVSLSYGAVVLKPPVSISANSFAKWIMKKKLD